MDKKEIIVIANQQNGLIEFNYEELKLAVIENMKPYRNIVLTEETLKEGTQTRAKLNNLVKKVDDKRKEIKKEYSQPLTIFENQVKDILAIVKAESDNLDSQIKIFEQQEKDKKKQQILEFYLDNFDTELFSFNDFFEEEWLLKKFTEKDWKKAIEEKAQRIENELGLLKSLDSGNETMLIDLYIAKGFDVVQAKKQFDDLQQRLKAIQQANENNQKQTIPITETQSSSPVALYHRTFRVFDCTIDDLLGIERYLNQQNIYFEKVGK